MSLEHTIRDAQNYLSPDDVDCLVYHYPCCDGSGAGVAAWMARGDTIKYAPLDYGKPFDEQQLRDKNVVLIDCSFKPDQLARVRTIAKKVMILDHHDSAAKNLSGEPGCFFYMHNSGALLSWHYFHGMDKVAPDVLQLIEDRDLWRWKQRDRSEPLFHAIISLPRQPDFKKYMTLLDPVELDKAIAGGRVIMQQNKAWCLSKIDDAKRCKFQVPNTSEVYDIMALELKEERLVSELSEELYNKYEVDFVMIWHQHADNRYKISFRNNNQRINVGDIASALGGGGHPRAAGASITFSPKELLVK